MTNPENPRSYTAVVMRPTLPLRGLLRRASAAVLAALLLAASVAAQAPEEPAEPAPPPSQEGEPSAEPPADPSPETPATLAPRRLEEYVPDSERPELEVEFRSDAPCRLLVDGTELGVLEADEAATFPVKSGKRWVQAVSLRAAEAEWSKIISVREEGGQSVRIRLQRELDELEARQRREQIYRDRPGERMWSRKDNGENLRWSEANEYCEQLRLGGFEDWRLPTMEELKSIQAIWSQATIKIIGAFTLTGCCPWSGELAAEGKAWNFDFRSRRPFQGLVDYSLGLRALCVRRYSSEEQEQERLRIEERRRAAEEAAQEPDVGDGKSEEPPGGDGGL